MKYDHGNNLQSIENVRFDQKLVPFLLLSQKNTLIIGLEPKNWAVLASAHFELTTGTIKARKNGII